MFTGIIEEIGILKEIRKSAQSSVLTIQGKVIFNDLHLGDSVAVNGVCLTVTGCSGDTFQADVMHETLNRSSLGSLKRKSPVNLERAIPVNGRFGGHMVSGHIDGVGVISKIRKEDNAVWYTFRAQERILRYIIEKGSIAVDGISLTIASVSGEDFSISAIPHSVKSTILSQKAVGDMVNLENDLVGKYIEKLFGASAVPKTENTLTKEFIEKYGF
ncbi:riboflavin synthase [Anaerocolumna jejuensis]|uniref:riboflavin synthase n=1 Tax=Anaerocolumna jejuensis TaxID=259063 RepID=UPI003F7BE19D